MAWSFLQSCAAKSVGAATTSAATFGTNLTSGSKLIAVVNADFFSSTTCTGIDDGNGNSFTKVADTGLVNSAGGTQLWVLDTPAGDVGTKPTITATWNNNTNGINLSLLVQEVSGLATGTSGSLDGTAGTLANNGSSPQVTGSPAYSSTASNEYLLSAVSGFGSGDVQGLTPAAGTADPNNTTGSTTTDGWAGFAYGNSTGGTETGGWTLTGGGGYNGWGTILVAFKLAGTAHNRTAALTVTPTFSAARTRAKFRTAALTVTPTFSAARTRAKFRTAALTVTPSFSAARTRGKYRTASLTVPPSFSAARVVAHLRHAALTVTPSFFAHGINGNGIAAIFAAGGARLRWAASRVRNQ